MFWSFCSSSNRNMFMFSSSNLLMIFANLLFVSKFWCCHAFIPPPKSSRDYRPKQFTNLAKRLENEFEGVPAKSIDEESVPPEKMTIFRLPPHIRPLSYQLKMVIDNKKSDFFGEVKINVSVSENSNTVLLHSHCLEINEVTMYHQNYIIPTSFIVDSANQLLKIRANLSLLKDEVYEIKVKFAGLMNTEFKGIYRSLNIVGDETKYMTTTQFEPTMARQAFPCFDEPHFRATFDIRIARYQHEVALSNMKVLSESSPDPSIDNRVWSIFEKTPPMPTYLVAFVVAEDFGYISDLSGKHKLWTKKNQLENYSYAHSLISKAVKYAENYTGIGYILPHLHSVAVEDFLSAAMENWGLMIFRSSEIKFKEYEDDLWAQHAVLIIVVHETIHQWFGNYVTIKWWDSLWLKEGFATLFSYVIGALVDPNWKLEDIFMSEVLVKAFESDGTDFKKPMTHPVNTIAEINGQFNAINYEKAASVLRMLSHMVSPATFQKALHMYLRSGYTAGGGVTSADDLWAALDRQLFLENRSLGNDLTVAQTMKSWTHQVGYPIVKVTRYNNGNRDDIGFKQEYPSYNFSLNEVNIQYQELFKPNNDEVSDSTQEEKEQEWIIPLRCTKGSNPNFNKTLPNVWLLDKNEVILPNEVEKDEWIVCNVQQTGYYRLNYGHHNWGLIAEVLDSSPEQIHLYNRHQIIYDVFTLIKGQMMPYSSAFKIIRSLDHENDTLVWETVTPLIDQLIWEFEGTKAHEGLKKFFMKRFHEIYKKVGFYEKSNDTCGIKYLRPQLLRSLCELGHTDCLLKAAEEFNKHDTIDSVPSYLKYTVISTALKVNYSSDLTWKKLRNYFKKQANPYHNDNLISSFRSLQDESTLIRFLSDLSVGKIDELQNYSLEVSLNHYNGTIAAMHFVQAILPKMSEYRAGEAIITNILNSISVKSYEQLYLIDEMIETAMKLNPKMYENIIKILNDKKHDAEAKVKALDNLSSQVEEALDSVPEIKISSALSYKPLQTSAAKSSFSQLIYCLIFTFVSWFLIATLTESNGN